MPQITRKPQETKVESWNGCFYYFFILFLNLKHCISFAKHRNESATGIHVLPILNPPPSSLPTPSLWVVPVHQPQASSIVHWTWTGNLFHTWYYTCFNAIIFQKKTTLVTSWSLTSGLQNWQHIFFFFFLLKPYNF